MKINRNCILQLLEGQVTMYALVSDQQIQLPAGSVLRMPGSWSEYDALRNARGNRSLPRIKFYDDQILLMSPLPRHGREANLIADIVKVLLAAQGQNYEAFTLITIELSQVGGIEPDYCFYINTWQAVLGQDRIDWSNSPPPDLVIEVDVTSYTSVDHYLPYQIPEVWLYRSTGLQIYQWQSAGYLQQNYSSFFPNIDLDRVIQQTLGNAAEQGSGKAIADLRRLWIG